MERLLALWVEALVDRGGRTVRRCATPRAARRAQRLCPFTESVRLGLSSCRCADRVAFFGGDDAVLRVVRQCVRRRGAGRTVARGRPRDCSARRVARARRASWCPPGTSARSAASLPLAALGRKDVATTCQRLGSAHAWAPSPTSTRARRASASTGTRSRCTGSRAASSPSSTSNVTAAGAPSAPAARRGGARRRAAGLLRSARRRRRPCRGRRASGASPPRRRGGRGGVASRRTGPRGPRHARAVGVARRRMRDIAPWPGQMRAPSPATTPGAPGARCSCATRRTGRSSWMGGASSASRPPRSSFSPVASRGDLVRRARGRSSSAGGRCTPARPPPGPARERRGAARGRRVGPVVARGDLRLMALRRAARPLGLQLPRRRQRSRGAGRRGGPARARRAGPHRPRRPLRRGALRRGGPGLRAADGLRRRAHRSAPADARDRRARPDGHAPGGAGPRPRGLRAARRGARRGPPGRRGEGAAASSPSTRWPTRRGGHWLVLTGCRKGARPRAR